MLLSFDALDEWLIKPRLLDFLLDSGSSGNLYASEVTFAGFKRRADLLKINGSTHAYEIKSDLDNLKRLTSQISDYHETFDKVTLVTTKKHLKSARNHIKPYTGIILITSNEIKHIRPARSLKRLNKYFLSCFLSKYQIKPLLLEQGLPKTLINQTEVYILRKKLVSMVNTSCLRGWAINSLKEKHSHTFYRYMKYKGQVTHPEDMHYLSA